MRSSFVWSLLLATVLPVQLASAQAPSSGGNRSVEERLQAIEDKLQQLEKRWTRNDTDHGSGRRPSSNQ